MGNTSVLSELGSMIWNHPYISCSLLIFLTPPFLPILKFFSPLLISTALFVVALVTLGPHFEQNHQDDETFLINASEFSSKATQEEETHIPASEQQPPRNVRRASWSEWVQSCADSWVSWVERKLQNDNWKGDSLNDDNVSILQEAFAQSGSLTRSVSAKLATRRIPDEGAEDALLPLAHSHSWSFDRPVASSSFFSPNPSFSRRHESEMNPLFENVIPPPIDYDMPPLITGPASITAPLFKSMEDDMDMDMSEDDDEDLDHSDLEVGESTVGDGPPPPPAANGTHHQSLASPPPEETSDPPAPVPEAASEREISHPRPEESLQDIPELEDVLPEEAAPTTSAEAHPEPPAATPAEATPEAPSAEAVPEAPSAEAVLEAPAATPAEAIPEAPAATPAEAIPEAAAATSAEAIPEAPAATSPEAPAATPVVIPAPAAEIQPHIVERSMSLPVHATHTDTKISEELPPVDENAPQALSHAISLPAAIILAPKATDTDTTLEAKEEVSTKDKLVNIETLSAAVVSEITTEEEEITQVEEKKKKDSRVTFQPDAPQLQITPPSTKVMLTPSPVKPSAGASSSSRPFVSRYSDSEDESGGDETIDLDSDVEVVGEEDSDSDAEVEVPLVKLKAPPKPSVTDQTMRQPPHTLVQA